MWVVDSVDDVDADFRVFYRVDGVADGHYGGLSAERFFNLACRLPGYRGVVRTRLEVEHAQSNNGSSGGARPSGQPSGRRQPQQIGPGADRQGVDPGQFASKSWGHDTVPDRETMQRRLAAMGR